MSRAASFWTLAVLLLMVVFASAAASPLYRVYQVKFGFSATTLTAVFAVYVLTLLVTMLFFGSPSDHLGRRPVIIAATGFSVAACVLFLAAGTVSTLFVARSLQGIATGLASGSIGAALFDLQPVGSQRASLATSAFATLGLALGALVSSALIEYAPAPTQLIWWALLAVFVAGTVAVLAMAEPGSKRSGVLGSMRPKIAVPQQARATFVGAIPCLVGVWALGGLYLSLGPSLAALVIGSTNRVWGGLVIFLLFGSGATATLAFRGISARAAVIRGSALLVAGLALTFVAIATTLSAAFLFGTAVAGVGFGLAFLGTFRMTTALATPGRSAALVTAVFVVAYLAFSVPALIAGVSTATFGLQPTALGYCAALAVSIAAAAGSLLLRSAEPLSPPVQTSPRILPPGPCTCPPCPRAFEEMLPDGHHQQPLKPAARG